MIAIAYYLLKVFICSSVLFLYYQFALRNKLFHQWNRYYLLMTILCSLLIPCFEFTLFTTHRTVEPIQLLRVVYSADEYVAEVAANDASSFSFEQAGYMLYALVSLVFLAFFFVSLHKIYRLVRSHAVQPLESIKFINTDVQGTPFSFLHFIFWNRNIDLASPTGRQIFQHELVHVQEKHTLDKIFVQVILTVFWWNPVFWFIRNELKMIHEFIADKKALGQEGSSAFAAMILHAAYPQHTFSHMTNSFFQSSIKRRLTMLTKQKNYKISYASRILALSIIAFLIFAFTVKTKTPANLPLKDNFTVVIDAGHGGNTGAHVGDVYEDELVLQLAKAVKAENRNNKINIVFTRETKHNMDLKERVNIAQQKNADLFISLHMNFFDKTADSQQKGIEVLVPKQNLHRAKSQLLGSALLASLKDVYRSYKYASIGETNAFIVNQNICPAVMLECGYISNENDRAFMTQPSNQKLIARQILAAVERYAASNELSTQPVMVDTAAPITVKGVYIPNVELKDTANPVVFLDGVKKGRLKELGGLDKLVPANEIKAMYVYKGKEAIKKFGKEGEQGVIELMTKNLPPPPAPTPPSPANNDLGVKVAPEEIVITADTFKIKPVESDVLTFRSDTVVMHQTKNSDDNEALVIIDGKESGKLKNINLEKAVKPNIIKAVSVYKGKSATDKYGDKGVQGVIEITTGK